MIYFDNAATSFIKPFAVYSKVYEIMKKYSGNPGRSGHRLSMKANDIVYEARETVAGFFGIDSVERICFTNNATAALNFAIKGIVKKDDKVLISGFEHNSVTRPLYKIGADVQILPWFDFDEYSLENFDGIKLIIINHVSNVNGNVANIKAIGEYAKKNKILFMVDASQSAGHIELDVNENNIDILACSGHKGLFGPQGTGILYIREGIDTDTLIEGGTGSFSENIIHPEIYPDKFEAGTLNVAGIGGLCEGIKYLNDIGLMHKYKMEQNLIEYLLKGLNSINGVKVYKNKNKYLNGNVVSVNIDGWDCVELSNLLSEKYDICVRGGLHCAPLAHKTMGTDKDGTLRISLSHFNTFSEINHFLNVIDKISNVL